MEFLVNIDHASKIPIHRQIYDEVRRSILNGRLAAGQKVPSTRQLSQSLGISRATVTLSYDYLLSEGYLEAHIGAGTFVSRKLPEDLMRADATIIDGRNSDGRSSMPATPEKATASEIRFSEYGKTLSGRDWLGFSGDEPRYQFCFGRPDLGHFPMRIWLQLHAAHARAKKLGELDSPDRAQGLLRLREVIAKYLSKARAVSCDPDQIIIVNGSQQAIDLVVRVLVDPQDGVAIENPGYVGAQKSLLAHGCEIVPVPVDDNGLNVDALKELCSGASLSAGTSFRNPKMLYVTPSHQFPTGAVLSLPRRLELLKWSTRTGCAIVEDDYDSEFRYKGRPMPALAGLSDGKNVIYIGTFSKVLFPALRLGYIVAPPELAPVLARAKWLTDRHSPLLEQQVLCDFISAGYLERHIRRMRSVYQAKRLLVTSTLTELLGNRVSFLGDDAGINVLIQIDTALSDDEVAAEAAQLDVGIASAAQYYLGDARAAKGQFLLNYGGLSDGDIMEGLARLAAVVRMR